MSEDIVTRLRRSRWVRDEAGRIRSGYDSNGADREREEAAATIEHLRELVDRTLLECDRLAAVNARMAARLTA